MRKPKRPQTIEDKLAEKFHPMMAEYIARLSLVGANGRQGSSIFSSVRLHVVFNAGTGGFFVQRDMSRVYLVPASLLEAVDSYEESLADLKNIIGDMYQMYLGDRARRQYNFQLGRG